MFHATAQERDNFEQLMDLLHKFHNHLPPIPSTNSTPASATHDSPGSPVKRSTAIAPIENGVRIALGEKLCVQIQFSME